MHASLVGNLLLSVTLVLFQYFGHCGAAKIVGFAAISATSHQAAVARIGVELTERGHEFALLVSKQDGITRARLSKPPFEAVRLVEFRGPARGGNEKWLRDVPREPSKLAASIRSFGLDSARHLLEDNATIAALRAEKFDLVVRDVGHWPTGLLSQILRVPEVEVFSITALLPFFGPRYNYLNPVAYVPQLTSWLTPNTGFYFRMHNFFQYALMKVLVMSKKDTAEQALSDKYGYRAAGSWSARSTAPVAIVNGDFALEYPHPIPPKIHMEGPLMSAPAKPLSGDLKAFLDGQEAPEGAASLPQSNGAVYVSMGTFARLTEEEVHGIASDLAALTQPVLWKISDTELPGNMTLASLKLPGHVRAIQWAPQNDILGHASTRVFVTHGGANSLYEAAYHATPIVTIPILADQHHNAAKSVHHGFGILLPMKKVRDNGKWLLRNAIRRILDDPSYQANAAKVQRRLVKPRTPAQQAADIVEHVLATGGEDYLGTAEHLYTWWQLALLDVYLVIFTGIAALLGLLSTLAWLLYRWACRLLGSSTAQAKRKQQ